MSVREIVMRLSSRAGTPANQDLNHAVSLCGRGALLNPVTVDGGTPVAHIGWHRDVRGAVDGILQHEPRAAALRRLGVTLNS